MVAGKTEGTMKIERVGRTSLADLIGGVGALLRYVAPGLLGLYVWTVVVDEGAEPVTWVTTMGAVASAFLIYALHTCFISRLALRPIIALLQLKGEQHPWISSDQRKLAEHGAKRLLLELSAQRWRRRVSDNAEAKAVQKELDKRCALGSFLYCSGYMILLVSLLPFYPVTGVTESELLTHVLLSGVFCLMVAFLSDYVTMKNDLWAAATYPHGKTPKVAPPKPKTATQQVKAATPKPNVTKKVKARKTKAKVTRSKKKSSR